MVVYRARVVTFILYMTIPSIKPLLAYNVPEMNVLKSSYMHKILIYLTLDTKFSRPMPFCAEVAKKCYLTIQLEETTVACRIQARFIYKFVNSIEGDLSTNHGSPKRI